MENDTRVELTEERVRALIREELNKWGMSFVLPLITGVSQETEEASHPAIQGDQPLSGQDRHTTVRGYF